MSILITRPYNIGINSQNKISKLGKKSLLIPLIKIKYLNIEISDSNYDYIVVNYNHILSL